ncbi:7702_t:CDS:1, partial [Diversispora eburnea]
SKSPIFKITVFLALKYVQIYIKKGNNTNFTNEYQLFTIALMLSNKWLNDKKYASKIWSEVSYISRAEIDTLEISFLKSLNFKMYITGEEHSFWLNCIKNYHLSDILEYLFAERIGNMAVFQLTLLKPGFNYEQIIDSKVIEPLARFEYG